MEARAPVTRAQKQKKDQAEPSSKVNDGKESEITVQEDANMNTTPASDENYGNESEMTIEEIAYIENQATPASDINDENESQMTGEAKREYLLHI